MGGNHAATAGAEIGGEESLAGIHVASILPKCARAAQAIS
jgi:hypothetical protein